MPPDNAQTENDKRRQRSGYAQLYEQGFIIALYV